MKNLIEGSALIALLSLLSCTKLVYTNLHRNQSMDAKPQALSNTKMNDSAKNIYYRLNASYPDTANAPTPLQNGFAHNDYIHSRPLYEALENGFTNIEADIFLVKGKLIVAHVCPYFKGKRTLEALYLEPLLARITKNNGKVYAGYNVPVTLMIDIKTNADNTYKALKSVLEKYRPVLSSYENGVLVNRAVTIVISGHKPFELIKMEKSRLAFIDKDLLEISSEPVSDHVYNMASCKYSTLINWNGNTAIPSSEKKKLCDLVAKAHKIGARVRLWASPEKKEVWDELLRCGVDLINTDELVTLKNYLTERRFQLAAANDLKLAYTDVVSID